MLYHRYRASDTRAPVRARRQPSKGPGAAAEGWERTSAADFPRAVGYADHTAGVSAPLMPFCFFPAVSLLSINNRIRSRMFHRFHLYRGLAVSLYRKYIFYILVPQARSVYGAGIYKLFALVSHSIFFSPNLPTSFSGSGFRKGMAFSFLKFRIFRKMGSEPVHLSGRFSKNFMPLCHTLEFCIFHYFSSNQPRDSSIKNMLF